MQAIRSKLFMQTPSENLASKARGLRLKFGGIQPGTSTISDQFLYTVSDTGSIIDGHTLSLSVDFATPDDLQTKYNNAIRATLAVLPQQTWPYLEAKLKWNGEADEFHQWDTLGCDEQARLLANFKTAQRRETQEA